MPTRAKIIPYLRKETLKNHTTIPYRTVYTYLAHIRENPSPTPDWSILATPKMLAWENSRFCDTPPLVSPRNDVWETTAEVYWWPVTTQIWVVLPYWWCTEGSLLQPIRSATEDWHVISMEFLRPFLRRHFEKADGGVAKCRLFFPGYKCVHFSCKVTVLQW